MITLEKITRPAMLTMGVVLALSAVRPAFADTVYVTSATTSSAGQLQVVDTATNTITPLLTLPGPGFTQGLIFNGPNDILYTTGPLSTGPAMLGDYNLVTHSSSTIATFPGGVTGNFLTLDPGGSTVLVSTFGPLERINLSTHAATTVSTSGLERGLAYDAAGHLFAVLAPTEVAQIDPVSGAVINSITLSSTGSAGANGLTFDPVTGHLFATDDTNNIAARGVYEIPTDLSSATLVVPGLVAAGLVSDGNGHLFIAGGASGIDNVDEYTIATHTLTTGPLVFGIFDVALAPTTVPPPPPSSTPEPASLLLLGIGLGTTAILQRRFVKS